MERQLLLKKALCEIVNSTMGGETGKSADECHMEAAALAVVAMKRLGLGDFHDEHNEQVVERLGDRIEWAERMLPDEKVGV